MKSTNKNSTYIKIVIGLIVGVLSGLYIGHFYNCKKTIAPKPDLETIQSILDKNPELNDAVAVISTKSATQYGKEFHNNTTTEGRRSVIAHPYSKQGSGVSVTISYIDAASGERKIMLMQKLKTRGKPAEGLKDEFDQIGGYTTGAGVEGSKKTGLSFDEEEARDAAEDKYVENGSKLNIKSEKVEKSEYITKDDLSKIGNVIKEYYDGEFKKDQYIKNLDPVEIKNYLKTKGITYTKDYNLVDAAMREFKEETGYNGPITPQMIKIGYTTDNYALDNVPNLHTIVSHIIIDLGKLDKAPQIYSADYKGTREANSFQPNGTEVGKLEWASMDKFQQSEADLKFNGVQIRKTYVPIINNLVRQLRNEELQSESNGMISSRTSIDLWTKHFAGDKKLPKANSEFGSDAQKQHKFDMCFAKHVTLTPIINAQAVAKIIDDCQNSNK